MKKILVLGFGYLGYHLANFFNSKNYDVTIIGRNSIYVHKLNAKVKFIESDLRNLDVIGNQLSSDTIVIYAAGSINASNHFSDIKQDIENNYISFVNLLNICSEKLINKFVFLSSAGTVYGNSHQKKIAESASLNPVNIYGLQKVYFEHLIKIKNLESNCFPYLIFRISNPYGGYQDPNKKQGIIPILVNKAIDNEVFDLWVDLNTTRDFIYMDDLLNCVYMAINLNDHKNGEIFNIGSGWSTSLKKIINIIEQNLDKKIEINFKQKNTFNIMANQLDISKIINHVGYFPNTRIEEGIALYIKEALF
jgi:nucleoside-diphosphate-sugar epimerase